MTMTSWQKLFGFGACMALFAGACTVSSGDGDEDDEVTTGIGGSGGNGGDGGTGGSSTTNTTNTTNTSSTTGTSTTGSSSTTGGGGAGGAPEELECLDDADGDITGDVATCDVRNNDNCCTKCVAANCCEAYSECFASEPWNICGGTPSGEGADSEISAFIDCMVMIQDGPIPGTDDDSDFANCIAEATETVSAGVCGNGTISGPTNELAVCIHGDEDGLDGCFLECLTAFDEDTCTY